MIANADAVWIAFFKMMHPPDRFPWATLLSPDRWNTAKCDICDICDRRMSQSPVAYVLHMFLLCWVSRLR